MTLVLCCPSYLVFSAPSQEIGWKERLRNDLFCVEWGVKTCSEWICLYPSAQSHSFPEHHSHNLFTHCEPTNLKPQNLQGIAGLLTQEKFVGISGKSGPKDRVALLHYYLSGFSTFSVPWAAGTHTADGSSRYAHTIRRHADGISRYSVPPSAGPLLPLVGIVGLYKRWTPFTFWHFSKVSFL